MWQRVFGASDVAVAPTELVERLHAVGLAVEPHFRGDDLGWTAGELRLPGGGTPLYLDRYLTAEDDLRDDLNAWAAWLETQEHEVNHRSLMERVIGTRQMVTVRKPIDCPDEPAADRACLAICRLLAARIDGIYQIDGEGFFAPDGTLLLREY